MNAALIQQAIEAIEDSRSLVSRMRQRQPAVQWLLDDYFSKTHAALVALRKEAEQAKDDALPDVVNEAVSAALGDATRTPKPLNYDPADPDKMVLPKGTTCGDCVHIKRCKGMFGHTETDTYCDWSPSRFHAAEKKGGASCSQ